MKRIKRLKLSNVAKRPEWWRSRPDEITVDAATVKKGIAKVIAITPLGFPVWQVFYGDEGRVPRHKINWSSASASRPELYGTQPGEKQTILIAAGIHGCEVEAVVGISNLISLLEAGVDRRGECRPELIELCKQYRILLLPCVNMDGRAISPDHRLNADMDQLRHAGGGRFKDGKLINPWIREFFPLPLERVKYPGGYPNSQGYNIQLDAAPGNLKTVEAASLLKLADEEQIDIFINLHSQPEEKTPFIMQTTNHSSPDNINRIMEIRVQYAKKLGEKGYDISTFDANSPLRKRVDINDAIELATGALSVTVEFAAQKADSFDAVLESVYLLFEVIFKDGLKRPFVERKNS